MAEGAVCVVLEQTGLDAGKFPWLSLAPAQAPWDATEGPAGTDVLRGELAPDALAGWRDTGHSVERPLRTPVRGNFTLLLDAAPGAQAPPETAALEVPQGKGRYIFSQLLIAHDFLAEPAARYALVNLLRYAATVPPHAAPVRAAVLADPQEEAFAKGFAPLGLKADVNPPSLEGCGVVIVYGSEASAQAFRPQKAARIQALREMVEAGGEAGPPRPAAGDDGRLPRPLGRRSGVGRAGPHRGRRLLATLRTSRCCAACGPASWRPSAAAPTSRPSPTAPAATPPPPPRPA